MSKNLTAEATPAEMKTFYLEQTRKSMNNWEEQNWVFSDEEPFKLFNPEATSTFISPADCLKLKLREQVDAFAAEAKVSTAGVRENQNVLCSWDHRYRINEYMFAMLATALARLNKELHPERVAQIIQPATMTSNPRLTRAAEDVFARDLNDIQQLLIDYPCRLVGGEVRSNTPRYTALMSRIYAAEEIMSLTMSAPDFSDTSSIFMWSFLTFMLGASGADYFTSSHGAPQKQSDKILSPDGAQYSPELYNKIVTHLYTILEEMEDNGYTFRLAALDSPFLLQNITYKIAGALYGDYLRQGPANSNNLGQIQEAIKAGLHLKLDFFGGSGYKTMLAILQELEIDQAFHNGFIRTQEDPFFHNIGFRVQENQATKTLEVVHDSVDASLLKVVVSANYAEYLKDSPDGQLVFNVDPDADRFVASQVLPHSALPELEQLGINSLPIGDRVLAVFSPNQFFLLLAENDRLLAEQQGTWDDYDNFDIHTYVSALAWDEWAAHFNIPTVLVPVGFKEIARVIQDVEKALAQNPGQPVIVQDGLNRPVNLGTRPKLHHGGEESGGRIGGPTLPLSNILGQSMIAVREKSSGEACVSAISLAARLYDQENQCTTYLHHELQRIFQTAEIINPMEFRGDIVHYNEAIFDPAELAKAKKEGIQERVYYNAFFHDLVSQYPDLLELKKHLSAALPNMAQYWAQLNSVHLWPDGIQFLFSSESEVASICLRPSGTDAKTKVYCDGKNKETLKTIFQENFQHFSP